MNLTRVRRQVLLTSSVCSVKLQFSEDVLQQALFLYWFQSSCRQQLQSPRSDLANGNILGHLNPNSHVKKK